MPTQDQILTKISFPELPLFKEGKVRSVFDFGDQLLIVASDRVSAFDFILKEGIPNKGALLTKVSKFWFDKTKDWLPNHLISCDVADFPEETKPYHAFLKDRSMLVKKTELIEIECVVRGYIVGSGWKDYQRSSSVCGIQLPEGLQQAQKFDEPLFTPASKAQMGEHDENISFENMVDRIGSELAHKLKETSLKLYNYAFDYANEKGIILADTKFEFGMLNGEIILIDEVLTPDSSRFWAKEEYAVNCSPPSFDKQIVRDYLESCDWNKEAPVPDLPQEIIQKAASRYQEVAQRLF